ncbi:antitoxin Xre/MbcA/ParS toxin-binding domain-containing protein [Stenotrophomonas maltophilia]|uniref:antitoxin Xre/MbcA/ParS toxin-binding domain-containing protein n=1 Tax=Stenotrophomonas maltophilia TaxID=40324 RepID=UPI0031BCA2C6|nr:DUF2384 domain-containing protein [Stenotrophomonas maltophilia]
MRTPFAVGDSRLAGPAIRAFAQIADAWSLTEQEQSAILGQSKEVAFASLHAGVDLHPETFERISHVLAIYRALHTIFPSRLQADVWIRRPNTAEVFKGNPALLLMCSGRLEDLSLVREYLNSQGLAEP